MLHAQRFDKSELGLVLSGALILAGCLGGSVWLWPYLQEAIAGPKQVTLAELRNAEDVGSLPSRWAEFPVTAALDTEIRLVDEISDAEEAKYVLLAVEDRYLFAEVKKNFGAQGNLPPRIVGLLQQGDGRGYMADAVTQLCQSKPECVPKLLPFVFQADYDVSGSAYAFQGLLAAGVIIGGVMSVVGIRRGFSSGGQSDVGQFDDTELDEEELS